MRELTDGYVARMLGIPFPKYKMEKYKEAIAKKREYVLRLREKEKNRFIGTDKQTCSNCGEIKKLTDFHKSKKSKNGYSYLCKKCRRERGLKRNREENKIRCKKYYITKIKNNSEYKEKGKLYTRKWRGELKKHPEKYKIYRLHTNETIKQARIRRVEKLKRENPEKYQEMVNLKKEYARNHSRKWRKNNPIRAKIIAKKEREKCKKQSHDLTIEYISSLLNIPIKTLIEYPELVEAKRTQLQIIRELKTI